MVNNKLIFSLVFSFLLLIISVNAKIADVAYVTKNMNPDAQVVSVFSELNLTYRLVDDSQISSTDFSQYRMIFIGDENFGDIEDIPVTERPSLIMNSYNYYSKLLYDDLGWSASNGRVGSSMINIKILKLDHPIAEGLSETFKVYTGSSTIYYLKGKKATGIDLIAYVLGSSHTSADAVVAAAEKGDVFLNGKTTNTRNVFFGMTKSSYWTVDTRKMFKNSVLWILRGSDYDHDGYFSDVDCNDEDPAIHPGVTDIPYNGIDENCDGYDIADVDHDGYCKKDYLIANKALQCNKEISNIGTDCNDANINIHPGANEIINSVDENCVNDAPVLIANILNYQFSEDNSLNNVFDLNNYFKDPEGNFLSYSVINNNHVKITINNGIVSFSSDKDFNGQEIIKFIANDSKLETQSNNVTITVTPVNDAPVLQPIPNVNVVEGNLVTITANASDIDGNNLTYSINDVRFIKNNNIFTWQTSLSSHGTYTFRVSVSDGILSDSEDVTINVLPKISINEFSSQNSGNDWVELYNINTYNVNLNGCVLEDAVNNQLVLSGIINQKTFLVFEWSNKLNNDGDTIKLLCNNVLIDQIIYGGGNAPISGLDKSTGRKSDGYDTDVDSNDFIVYNLPTKGLSNSADMEKPVVILISPNSELLNVDHVNFTFSASDNNASILNCSLYSNINGDFKLIQSKNVNNPYTGSFDIDNINDGNYIWNVKCKDVLNEAFALNNYIFSIDEPDKPIINSLNVSTEDFSSNSLSLTLSENKNYKFEVTVSDPDNNIESTKWYLDNNLVSSNLMFNWEIGFNFEGNHNVTFIVEDTTKLKDSKTWNIVVNNVNRNPIVVIEDQTINEDEQKTFKINISDPDADVLSLSVTQKDVNKVDCIINGENLTLKPAANWNGLSSCKIKASDPRGGFDEKTFNINVLAVNDAPVINKIQDIIVNENEEAKIIVSAHDVDNNNLIYSINDSRFSQNNNVFSWKTTYDNVGIYNVLISVSDGILITQQQVKITVNNVNNPPIISPIDNVTINEDSGYNENPVLLNAVDSDGTIEEFKVTQEDTSKVDCVVSDKVLGYTPAKDFYGLAFCVIEVRDNLGAIDTSKFYITVNNVNDAPVIDLYLPLYDPIIKLNGQQSFSIIKHDIDNKNSDLLTRWYVDGASSFIGDNFNYVNNNQQGNFEIKAVVSDGNLESDVKWDILVSEVPFSKNFDLSALEDISNKNNLGNVHNFVIKNNFGKIEFLEAVDLRTVIDIDNNVEISNIVGINSNNFAALKNKKARITLYNLPQQEVPEIYYNSIFTRDASQVNNICTICSNIEYINNQLTFNIEGFSTFRAGNVKSCSELNGFICDIDETCSGNWITSFEQRCCSSICKKQVSNETELDKCDNGVVGDIDLTIKDPDNGDDFKPGETVDINVKVKNKGKDDLDIVVKAILFDTTENEEVKTVDKDVSVDSDEDETVELELEIPTKDLDDEHDYILFVKAYEDDEEEKNCNEDVIDLDIEREKHDVIIKEFRVTPDSTRCGELVSFNVNVENIGRDDEEDVYVTLKNNELDIDEKSNEFDLDDFNGDDNDRIEKFLITMPQNAKNKDYTIIAEVLFEDGSYSETKTLTVSECSVKEYLPSLSVSIEPQKTSGYEQKIIKSNINNRILIFLIFGNIVLLLAIIYVTQLIFSRR